MHLLPFLAAATASLPPAPPARPTVAVAQARASVRILHAQPASRDWSDPEVRHKREIVVREADGWLTRLRLVEHE